MKCKCKLIDNLIPLSSCQIDLFISLVRRSDEQFGTVRGVYYKDVLNEIRGSMDKKANERKEKCCNQTFYTALRELEKYGIIRVCKANDTDPDFDVYICESEYPEHTKEAFQNEPYINFNDDVFYCDAFKTLKAHEKYLFLYFYQYTFPNNGKQTKSINKKHFYKEMVDKLGVAKETLRKYLHSLKLFFSIGTLKGNLLITRLAETNKKYAKDETEEHHVLEQYIVSQCHRLKMKYTSETVEGLITYTTKHRQLFNENGTLVIIAKMMQAMEKSVEGIKPGKRKLSGGFINKLLTAEIQVSDYYEPPEIKCIYNMEKLGLCIA